jgi:hypothetical protein
MKNRFIRLNQGERKAKKHICNLILCKGGRGELFSGYARKTNHHINLIKNYSLMLRTPGFYTHSLTQSGKE